MEQDGQGGEVVVSDKSGEKPNVFVRIWRGIRAFFASIALFIRQVFAELRKVITPTRQELIKFTLVVLAFVTLMMVVVYGLDTVFTWLTQFVFGTTTPA